MSYKSKAIIISLIAIIFFGLGIFVSYFYIHNLEKESSNNTTPKPDNNTNISSLEDNKKFKNEYESFNTQLNENSENKYLSIEILENNKIKYASISDIESLFNSKTGIVYFGFPTCPWCRNLVPVLLEVVNESNLDTIYYMDIKDIRDQKKLGENRDIIIEDEGTEEYKTLINLFNDSLDPYAGLNDETIKRIYAPTVFFIKNGKIISKHVGTVDSQEDPKIEMTSEQKEELKNILKTELNKITEDNSVCNEDRNC